MVCGMLRPRGWQGHALLQHAWSLKQQRRGVATATAAGLLVLLLLLLL